MVIRLEFDQYKQLEILMDDYCVVNKKQEDLKKVQHFLRLQNYMPVIHLDFYLSNNPIKLLENFFIRNNLTIEELRKEMRKIQGQEDAGEKKMKEFLDKIEEYIGDPEKVKKDFGKEREEDFLHYGTKAREFVKKYLGQIHSIMKRDESIQSS